MDTGTLTISRIDQDNMRVRVLQVTAEVRQPQVMVDDLRRVLLLHLEDMAVNRRPARLQLLADMAGDHHLVLHQHQLGRMAINKGNLHRNLQCHNTEMSLRRLCP